MEKKKLEVIFAPGCFDTFDGTQEELDELTNEIKRLVESGELMDTATPVDPEDYPEELLNIIENFDPNSPGDTKNRNVH